MPDAFLQLVKDFAADLKVGGGSDGVAAVTNQSGIIADLVRWIRDGDTYIQSIYLDWDFMWTATSGLALTIGSNVVPPPSGGDLNYLRRNSMVIREGTATAHAPDFMEWGVFKRAWDFNAKTSDDYPSNYTVRPDGAILLSHNPLTADNVAYNYYKTPTRMTADADISVIMQFDNYAAEIGRRCILARAAMFYATREDAPEVMATAASEYEDTLSKLEARYHPENQNSLLGSGEGQLIEMQAS